MSDDRGIVVLGFPRSGTTLVRRLLDAHPRIACPPETQVFAACARFLLHEPIDGGMEIGVEAGLGMIGVDPAEVRRQLRTLAVGFLERHAAAQGKPVWAEKHPFDVFHLDAIEGLLGDSVRYLIVVRHPLDVVVSCRDLVAHTGRLFAELQVYAREDARPLCGFAAAWRDTTRALLALAARRGAPILRYEDLVADPPAALGKALAALGEDLPAGLVENALSRPGTLGFGDWTTWSKKTISGDRQQRWRELAPSALADLQDVLAGAGEAAGYPLVPVPPRASREDALRRLQLATHLQTLRRKG
jgi:hypothetical protein